jgi:hypothetical protein
LDPISRGATRITIETCYLHGNFSAQATQTKFDEVLFTIRSHKSFFEVTQAIESSLPRFHIPKLMEYVAHGDRPGVVVCACSARRQVDKAPGG